MTAARLHSANAWQIVGGITKLDALRIPSGQEIHLTAFSCGLLMIITQEPAQSLAALDAPLSIEVTVPRK
jgi:hypothetical protein